MVWRRKLEERRYRLGARLLRPYVNRVGEHYMRTAAELNSQSRTSVEHSVLTSSSPAVRGQRCEYMAIGLMMADRASEDVGYENKADG